MPPSREIRARQNRARERIAAAHAEHRRSLRRRQIAGSIAGAIVVVGGGVALAIALTHSGGSSGAASTTTTSAAAVSKRCVGLKDPLPKGAPAMPLTAGPAPTKLGTKDLKVGTGAVVPKNAKVTVNYVGVACSTGKIFDSSYSRNQTFDADLSGGVIPGWIQGIPGMKVGGVRLLSIPADLAYGAQGNPPTIGPDEPLFFLVSVVKLG
jgi:FKBP-type peptidyl-prolyl cis-trans isomerase